MPRRLEAFANIATIIACVLAGVWFARDLLAPSRGRVVTGAPARQAPQVYAAGDQLPVLPIEYGQAKATVLVVIREGCRYCQESVPFYRKLAPAVERASAAAQLVIVSSDPANVTRDFLTTNNIAADNVIQAQTGVLKVPGTPTVILATPEGRVANVWVGRLDAAEESEVMSALGLAQ